MRAPVRILMTTDAIGGVWTYALGLIRDLRPHGASVFLAIMGREPSPAQRAALDAEPHLKWEFRPYALEWMEEPWSDMEAAGEWLLDLADSFKPDLVHLNGYAHAALPWEVPVLVVAHSCVLSWWRAVKGEPAPDRFRVYEDKVRRGLESADLVIAPTQAMLEAIEQEYGALAGSACIPNGCAPNLFNPAPKKKFVFSAGRLWDEAKNLTLLEKIAGQVSWPIRCAGDKTTRETSGVEHLGELDSTSMAAILAEAGIYAAPALYEPFGLAILEAALSGCALVLADIPSLRELWEGAAEFVPADDPAAWVLALNALGSDPERRRAGGKKARQQALMFSQTRMTQAYGEAYAEMLAAASKRIEATV